MQTTAGSPETATGPSLLTRALALVVLLVAAWVLLDVVVGFVTWIAGLVAVLIAVVAVFWALRRLL
jgi:hypothetical protein